MVTVHASNTRRPPQTLGSGVAAKQDGLADFAHRVIIAPSFDHHADSVGGHPKPGNASRDAVDKLRLDGAPTPDQDY